jgi:hypothetical protein
MNWWPEFERFLFVVLGAIVGSSLGAWLSGYSSEKGKRLATHEDIENVLREVKIVTHETETIKAKISGESWRSQRLWEERRSAFAGFLEALAVLNDSIGRLRLDGFQKVPRADFRKDLLAVLVAWDRDYQRAKAMVEIFLSEETVKIVREFLPELKDRCKEVSDVDGLSLISLSIRGCRSAFIGQAHREFSLPESLSDLGTASSEA